MDKQTLSGYGWIVIVTLVLAVLLALATPFGTFVGDGVVTTVNGLINTSSKAVDEDQIDTMSDKWENKFSTFDKAGSVNSGSEEEILAPGLYKTDGTFVSWEQLTSMEYCTIEGNDCCVGEQAILTVTNGVLKSANDETCCSGENFSSDYLNGKLVISDDVTKLQYDAFAYCHGLTNIIIPESVTSIGSGAFLDCINLVLIDLGEGVETIKDYAFYDCVNLKSITIPNSVTKIENYIFDGCEISEINYKGTKAEWSNIVLETEWNENCPEITVHCTDGNIIIPEN